MRILFDTTRALARGRRWPWQPRALPASGLARVSDRLRSELRGEVLDVGWVSGAMCDAAGRPVHTKAEDVFFTAELMAPSERPGFADWLTAFEGSTAALFHDAIPLRHPEFAWPKAAARHPAYMQLLGRFDHVFCISTDARADLLGWWRWARLAQPPPTSVLHLGADAGGARGRQRPRGGSRLLSLGIVEPRKGQDLLLDTCEALWRDGREVECVLIGRVNPHYGKGIAARARQLAASGKLIRHLDNANDADVSRCFAETTLCVSPSRAEGLGLPVLESLWRGVPCVASDIASHAECAAGGGCALFEAGNAAALQRTIETLLDDPPRYDALANQAARRALPTWRGASEMLLQHCLDAARHTTTRNP